MKVYLDNAATTSIAKEVIEEIEPYLSTYFGNPSSTHSFGRKTKNAIEIARQAGAMYDKFSAFTDDLIRVGSNLKTTQSNYVNLRIYCFFQYFLSRNHHTHIYDVIIIASPHHAHNVFTNIMYISFDRSH